MPRRPQYEDLKREQGCKRRIIPKAGSEAFALLSRVAASRNLLSVHDVALSLHLTDGEGQEHVRAAGRDGLIVHGTDGLLRSTVKGDSVVRRLGVSYGLTKAVHEEAVALHMLTGYNVTYHRSSFLSPGRTCVLLDVVGPPEVLPAVAALHADDTQTHTAASRVVAASLPFEIRGRLRLLPDHTSRWIQRRNYEHVTVGGWDTVAVPVRHAGAVVGAISLISEKNLSDDQAARLARQIQHVAW